MFHKVPPSSTKFCQEASNAPPVKKWFFWGRLQRIPDWLHQQEWHPLCAQVPPEIAEKTRISEEDTNRLKAKNGNQWKPMETKEAAVLGTGQASYCWCSRGVLLLVKKNSQDGPVISINVMSFVIFSKLGPSTAWLVLKNAVLNESCGKLNDSYPGYLYQWLVMTQWDLWDPGPAGWIASMTMAGIAAKPGPEKQPWNVHPIVERV